MPSTSAAQAKLMRAVAHGWKKPGGDGPSKAVAKDFTKADKGRKFGSGKTKAKINKQDTRHGKLDLPFKSLKRFAGKAAGGEVDKKEGYAKGGGVESKGKTKGKIIKYAKGGSINGCAMRGFTKGKMVKG